MTPVYPTQKIYVDLDNDNVAETNISERVNSSIDGQHGILSYRDTDRLSSSGSISFDIDNADGTYTDFSSLIGKAIRITLTLRTREKQIFFGYITEAKIDPTHYGTRSIHVTARDWFNIASKTRLESVPLATFVTADEALPTLINATPNPPVYTDFEVGFEEFPNAFDGALRKTTVYSELDKITKSELGYLYLRFRDTANGETLRFEDYLHRGSTHSLTEYPAHVVSSTRLKYHGNAGEVGYLKYHGNAGETGYLKISLLQNAYFDGLDEDTSMIDSEWEIGQNVINDMSVTIVPRDKDATPVVVYNLDKPIYFGTNNKVLLKGDFTDPSEAGNLIQVFDAITPVLGTDILANSVEDGSGVNYTANFVVKLFTYGTNSWRMFIQNNSFTAYLTKLQIRAKGIYKNNPIEIPSENVESKEDIVKAEISDAITREYSNQLNTSKTFADGVVAINRTPIKVMKTVSFLGNMSENVMLAFMYLEQGDKVRITESNPSHTGDYYIQGIKFKIDFGGIVYFTWYLKEDTWSICEPIAVAAPVAEAVNAIDFGILPYLANLPQFSYSFWIRRDEAEAHQHIIDRTIDTGSGRRGHGITTQDDGKIYFESLKTPDDGEWNTTSAVLTSLGQWYHIVLTYDNTTDTSDPLIYVNGTSVPVIETDIPVGTSDDDSDCALLLFNRSQNPAVPALPYAVGADSFSLKDVRIYNRILSPADVTELAAGEDDYSTVQDGLLFNGIYAPKDNISDYVNDTILTDDWVLDSVHKAVGIPYNHDTSLDDFIFHGEAL